MMNQRLSRTAFFDARRWSNSAPTDDEPPSLGPQPVDRKKLGIRDRWRGGPLGAALLLFSAAVLAYGPYILAGGFVHDDWAVATVFRFNEPGFVNGLATGLGASGRHPVNGLYTALVHETFGLHQQVHLAWVTLVGVLTSLLFYAALCAAGLSRSYALVLAGLLLVFPGSDAGRLWVSGAGVLAVTFLLGGYVLALRSLPSKRWKAVVNHLPASACFCLSILTYDVAGVAILGSILIYRLRVGWRQAAIPWAMDVAVVIAGGLYVLSGSSKAVDSSGSGLAERLPEVLTGVRQMMVSFGGSVGAPWAVAPNRANALLAIGVVVLVCGAWRARRDRELRMPVVISVYGILIIAAGSAVLLAVPGYSAMGQGIFNRVNSLSGLGYVMTLFGTLVTGILLVGVRRLTMHGVGVATALAGLALGGMFSARLFEHQRAYARSVEQQGAALDRLGGVPAPPRGTTVFLARVAGEAALGVPVFQATWDASGAFEIAWERQGIAVYPEATLTDLLCTPQGIVPEGPLYADGPPTPYSRVLFLRGDTGMALAPRSAAQCETARRWFRLSRL